MYPLQWLWLLLILVAETAVVIVVKLIGDCCPRDSGTLVFAVEVSCDFVVCAV